MFINIPFHIQVLLISVAPPVRNLEAYSIDATSVSLRYDLPYEPRGGIPKFVQVLWHDTLMSTRSRANVSEIKNCKLWPEKYCVDLVGLVGQRVIKISVSLKNQDTHMFGRESSVDVFTTHSRSKYSVSKGIRFCVNNRANVNFGTGLLGKR